MSSVRKSVIPAATDTFKDSFLPCMGMAIVTSLKARMRDGSPDTSLPKIKTIFFLLLSFL